MNFKYSGINQEGRKVSGVIDARSLDEAKNRLRGQKIIFSSLEEESPSLLELFRSSKTISPKDLANLSRDLAIYIKSGISIVGAIKLAKSQYSNDKKISTFLNELATNLEEGKNFFQALETQKVIELPNFYKQSIKVSENSGILDKVLLELAYFLKEQDRITRQIQSSFAYPMFIIVVSVLMVGFMLSFVVPKISSIFEQMHQELPPITKFVIALGDGVSNYWSVIVGAIFGCVALYKWQMKTNKNFKRSVDALILRLPLVGKIAETSELARFSYITSVLLRSGVPFVQAVNLSAKILNNLVLSELFENASARVVEGGRLSAALAKSGANLDKSFVQAITLGEETSEVIQVLENLSELYIENNKDKIGIFLSLLEPFLMLFVGGMIGFIITSMLLPIFSMNIG